MSLVQNEEPERAESSNTTTPSTEIHIEEPALLRQEEPSEPKIEDKKPAITPMPWKQLIVVLTLYICDTFSFTTLLPYVAYMVADFKILDEPDEEVYKQKLGYFVGLVASSYYFAQLFSSFIWGLLSDKFGRRPILLSGVFASCIMCFLFGLSKNIYMAVATRFLFGIFNGNLGIYKTYIGEITDKTNQSKAFSYIGLCFGFASIIGPILGGFFSRPVALYPNFFQWIDETIPFLSFVKTVLEFFPYILPNLFVSLMTGFAFVLGIFVLKESNQEVIERKNKKKELQQIKIQTEETTQEEEMKEEWKQISWKQKLSSAVKQFFQGEMFKSRIPISCCLLYAICGFSSIAIAELIPLWAILTPAEKGIGFSQSDLGILGAVSGVFILIFNLFFVSRILNKFGKLRAFQISCIICIPFLVLYPELSYLALLEYPIWPNVLLWIGVVFLYCMRFATNQVIFTAANIFVNNCVQPSEMGQVNGIATGLASGLRALGPIIIGPVFAVTNQLNIVPFILDIHVGFFLVALCYIFKLILSALLPKSVDEPKARKKASEEPSPSLLLQDQKQEQHSEQMDEVELMDTHQETKLAMLVPTPSTAAFVVPTEEEEEGQKS